MQGSGRKGSIRGRQAICRGHGPEVEDAAHGVLDETVEGLGERQELRGGDAACQEIQTRADAQTQKVPSTLPAAPTVRCLGH